MNHIVITWNQIFLEVDSMVVSWWIVTFLRCVDACIARDNVSINVSISDTIYMSVCPFVCETVTTLTQKLLHQNFNFILTIHTKK